MWTPDRLLACSCEWPFVCLRGPARARLFHKDKRLASTLPLRVDDPPSLRAPAPRTCPRTAIPHTNTSIHSCVHGKRAARTALASASVSSRNLSPHVRVRPVPCGPGFLLVVLVHFFFTLHFPPPPAAARSRFSRSLRPPRLRLRPPRARVRRPPLPPPFFPSPASPAAPSSSRSSSSSSS